MTGIGSVMVTGGAGFIGSAVVRHLVRDVGIRVVNVDALTYAANLSSLAAVDRCGNYCFEHADIRDREAMRAVLERHRPDAIMHLAAESHVDRSIDGPGDFISTNISGTYTLLEAARAYWSGLEEPIRSRFRFHHVSTDEVFGSLEPDDPAFTELTPYAPRSPYAASKAASDHLVRAWHETWGLPAVLSNCSNNYGPYQFPEKLIPLMILKGLAGEALPVYGSGTNVRDWLHVEDHARALWRILSGGRVGETYAVGGDSEMRNIDVVTRICALLDTCVPAADGTSRAALISYVTDRPGHDFRYAIDSSKLRHELGWAPRESFDSGLRKTVEWYLQNRDWWQAILETRYSGTRLGVGG